MSFYSAANRRIFDAIRRVNVRAEEPRELAVTVAIDADRLTVTLNGKAHVIDVTEGDGELS